jgi:hypothetical protein
MGPISSRPLLQAVTFPRLHAAFFALLSDRTSARVNRTGFLCLDFNFMVVLVAKLNIVTLAANNCAGSPRTFQGQLTEQLKTEFFSLKSKDLA